MGWHGKEKKCRALFVKVFSPEIVNLILFLLAQLVIYITRSMVINLAMVRQLPYIFTSLSCIFISFFQYSVIPTQRAMSEAMGFAFMNIANYAVTLQGQESSLRDLVPILFCNASMQTNLLLSIFLVSKCSPNLSFNFTITISVYLRYYAVVTKGSIQHGCLPQ